jgi:uncharacterized protein (TIGR02145 family)
MKKILLLIICFWCLFPIQAQVPQAFSYKVLIKGNNGNPHSNKKINLKISIIQDNVDGTVVYTEKHQVNTSPTGIVDIEIGRGTPLIGLFTEIDWKHWPYFVKAELDLKCGGNYNLLAITELLSVPYAMYAGNAANGFSGNYNDLANQPFIFDGKWQSLTGKPTNIAGYGITDAFDGKWLSLTGKPSFAPVATSGNYADLINKPLKIGDFTSDMNNQKIINLANPVNNLDAANKAYVDALKEIIYNELLEAGMNGIVKDIDGNTYKTIKIVDLIWMAENLKTTKYNDGSPIPNISDNTAWANLTTQGFCWYDNDSVTYKAIYGALYNWYAVSTKTNGNKNICPAGWHVSTDAEWTKLTNYLGILNAAGGKLKEAGFSHWIAPNTGATNETGFTALPGGCHYDNGAFGPNGTSAFWWTSDEYSATTALFKYVNYQEASFRNMINTKKIGISVRCIRDN